MAGYEGELLQIDIRTGQRIFKMFPGRVIRKIFE